MDGNSLLYRLRSTAYRRLIRQVPTRPTATERKIEWLLNKTGKEQMFKVNLAIMPMASCKAFERLAAAGLIMQYVAPAMQCAARTLHSLHGPIGACWCDGL